MSKTNYRAYNPDNEVNVVIKTGWGPFGRSRSLRLTAGQMAELQEQGVLSLDSATLRRDGEAFVTEGDKSFMGTWERVR